MSRLLFLNLASAIALFAACDGKVGQDATQVGGAQSVGGAGGEIAGSGGALAAGGTGGADDVTTIMNSYCNGLLAGETCSLTIEQAGVHTVNMLLVIDESGSMKDQPTSTTTANKWAMLGQALTTTLASFANEINFGLLLFPYDPAGIDTSSSVSSCGVPSGVEAINVDVASGTANEEAIVDFVRSQTPAGGTPTSKALKQAYWYFTQGNGKALLGTKWIILVTDGGPNCNDALQCAAYTCTLDRDMKCGDGTDPNLNCCDTSTAAGIANRANLACLDDQGTITQIANLKAAGIQTYVMGLPGSEPYADTLNNMALIGGVPVQNGTNGESYYAVSASNYVQDLSDDLTEIMTPLVRHCDFPLYPTPTDASKVIVVADCALLSQVPAGTPADAGVDGYYVDFSQTPARVRVVGAPCNNIMTNGAQHVDVIQGCTSTN